MTTAFLYLTLIADWNVFPAPKKFKRDVWFICLSVWYSKHRILCLKQYHICLSLCVDYDDQMVFIFDLIWLGCCPGWQPEIHWGLHLCVARTCRARSKVREHFFIQDCLCVWGGCDTEKWGLNHTWLQCFSLPDFSFWLMDCILSSSHPVLILSTQLWIWI